MKMIGIIIVGLLCLCFCLCGCKNTMFDQFKSLEINQVGFFSLTEESRIDRIFNIKREERYFMVRRMSEKDMNEILENKEKAYILIPSTLFDKLIHNLKKVKERRMYEDL